MVVTDVMSLGQPKDDENVGVVELEPVMDPSMDPNMVFLTTAASSIVEQNDNLTRPAGRP